MTIDAHQHFWKFDPVRDAWIGESMAALRRDFLPRDLQPLLEKEGVDGCVAVQADQSVKETEFLLEQAKQFPFIKKVVGWIDLSAVDIEEQLTALTGNGKLVGFRHILQAEPPEKMSNPAFLRGIAALEKFNYTYDILIYPQHLDEAFALARAFPNQYFVIDHLAKPFIKDQTLEPWRKKMQTLANLPHVYCKLSGMVTEADHTNWKVSDFTPYLDTMMEAFGAKRLMFGSDWPVCLLSTDYRGALSIIRNYVSKLSVNEQQMILGGTACQFYSIQD